MSRPSSALSNAIASTLQSFVADNATASAVALVATKDTLLALETAGHADREAKRAMTDDTMFWVASMTKPMSAVLLMIPSRDW